MTGEERTRQASWPPAVVARVFAMTLLFAWVAAAHAAEPCTPAFARVVSVQGNVELRRPGANWQAAELNSTLCAGDMVRVHQRSRAALLLSNETTLRLDQGTALTLLAPDDRKATLLEQISGGLLAITRTPRPFRIRTPFVNANVEGTEFAVRVEDNNASIAVYEGQVVAENDAGSVALGSGESAVATRNAAPTKAIVIRTTDAVAWTLYFPTVFDYRLDPGVAGSPGEAARQKSIELYRKGQIAEALAEVDKDRDGVADPRFQTYRAGLLLLVGRVDEARPEIERALRADPNHSDAHTLLSIVAVVENDKDKALESARRAVSLDPTSPGALIALSYAQQARFEIEQAVASVQQAVRLDPSSALAHARRAELELSIGNLDNALAAAEQAVRLNPTLGKTLSALGFAHLARINTRAASASFERAIEFDQADPLPRLGLGLTKIRDGDLRSGKIEIEIATILDPRNSLVRSYLGKAYYEEKRDGLAGAQLGIAREIDPQDPTPYFYDAIRKQSANRPVEALRDVNKSIELNDNRAVYRSRFLLDDDRAARTTSLATIYGELGFERLSIVESVKALTHNPASDAAHRQLATAYTNLPRHDIARLSEALQAQVRQPLTLSPIDPQISTDNLGILRGSGPSRLGTNEFNQLFARDGVRFQADGIVGTRKTRGDQFIFSGLSGNFAYAASQLHYETDGFRVNNDAQKNSADLFVQGQLSPYASLQLSVRHSDFTLGKTFFPFDPLVIDPEKIKERGNVARLSGHFIVDPASDWVVSLSQENRVRVAETFPDAFLITETRAQSSSFELQRLGSLGSGQVIAGAQVTRERDLFPGEQSDLTANSESLYAYAQWRVDPIRLSVQGGLALEHVVIRNSFFTNDIERKKVSPKLGVVWTPRPETTVRAAAFSAVRRPFIANQTLEPTQVAGFNQFFTGFETLYGDRDGIVSRRIGVGIDERLSADRFIGAEFTLRRLAVPSLIAARDFRWNESTGHVYLYDALAPDRARTVFPNWAVATSFEYDYERISRPQILTGPEGIVRVTTHHLPIGLRFFRGPFALHLSATYVKQSGEFSADVFLDRFPKSSSGWIADASAEFRLPRRTGTVVVGVRNAFEKSLDLFEIDPFNPRDAIGRFGYVKLRLVF